MTVSRASILNDRGWAYPLGKRFNDSVLSQILSVAFALLAGKGVSRERVVARAKICQTCPYVRATKTHEANCSICGCPVRAERKLVNLARFEETDKYGCKYVDSDTGESYSQWKKHGV
jgi:hypothetical protein